MDAVELEPKKALDVVLFGQRTVRGLGPTLLKLKDRVKVSEFAEDFLEMDGLNELLKVATTKDIEESLQGMILQVIVGLLVYENALDQVEDSQELVDRIYSILMMPNVLKSVKQSASKPVLEILVVICGRFAEGYKMVIEAAQAKHGVEFKPWSCLIPLLDSHDLAAVKPTLLLMNLLLKKRKQNDEELSVKELMFQWETCGLLSVMSRLSDRSYEDEAIKRGLQAFQQMSNVTIPRSWREAARYQAKYEELRQQFEKQGEKLFIAQQQQAKFVMLKQELGKAQETIKALNLLAPGTSKNYHPTKRFSDGGGIPLAQLCSGNKVDLDVTKATEQIAETRAKLFEEFVKDNAIRSKATKMFGGMPGGGAGRRRGGGGGRLDPLAGLGADDGDLDFLPPDDDGWGGPPPDGFDGYGPPPGDPNDEWGGPPPGDPNDFGDIPPPPEGDYIPPPPGGPDDIPPPPGGPDDIGPPPPAGDIPPPSDPSSSIPPPPGPDGQPAPAAVAADGTPLPPAVGPDGQPVAAPATVVDPATGQAVPAPAAATTAEGAQPTPAALGEQNIAAPPPAATSAPTTGVPPPPVIGLGGPTGPPPPPPPKIGLGGRVGGPPPPPPPGGFGKGAAKGPPGREFYKGKKPEKKMKPFHWEKGDLPKDGDTIWHRIHDKNEYNFAFDYDEFESMYSQKEIDRNAEKEKPKKKQVILLIDAKVFQNMSIALRKLPSIPNIQQAITSLDDETLPRDLLWTVVENVPGPDVVKQFNAKAATGEKKVEEYEPPEQFIVLTQNIPAFKARCSTWLFTMDFEENSKAVIKPILRLTTAMECITGSKHLPYFLGLLLGFGNMMNHGNAMKGNAAMVPLSTLGKLDGTKDNRGKISLMQHLFSVVRKENMDALDLHEELKYLTQQGINQIKFEDLEKGISGLERDLKQFAAQVLNVKKQIEKVGAADADDAYVPRMAEFQLKAEDLLKEAQAEMVKCKQACDLCIKYFSHKRPLKPEEIIAELAPFVDRVKKEASEAAKEKKRLAKKGKKVGEDLNQLVGKLQESMVT